MKIHLISTAYILSPTFTNVSPYQMIMLCSGDGDLESEDRGLESFVSKKIAVPRMPTPDIVWRDAMMDTGYSADDIELMKF